MLAASTLALALGVDPHGPAFTDVTYHGAIVGVPGEPEVAVVTPGGEYLGLLTPVGRHSPPRVSWGYMGPADLARTLLISALGESAKCGTCRGGREVVWTVDGVIPRDPRRHRDDEAGECIDCDRDGLRHLPYREFSERYVARWCWPDEWRINRSEVLAWLSLHGICRR
jgi:hypothetical protein